MLAEHFDDKPKSLGSPLSRTARLAELRDPHIAPLTAFVDALRAEMGADYRIPYFDPWDGGVAAEILYLLEAPGAKAVVSGFISRNNPDESAKNFFQLNQQSGISRKRTITWNIVPWYIGSGSRIRPANSDDIEVGIRPLNSLLNLLPRLRAIVLIGQKAQRGSNHIARLRPDVRLFKSPHPSPLFVNKSTRNREKILTVLREVADYLDTSGHRSATPCHVTTRGS
jgi:uracil-DNA glycosylase